MPTDWPIETYEECRERLMWEMHDTRARAIGLARFYLRQDKCEKAKRVLDDSASKTRAMGEELIERRWIDIAQEQGATWEQVVALRPGPAFHPPEHLDDLFTEPPVAG